MSNSCKECAYYKTPSCIGKYQREILIEDYGHDCFTTEFDKMMCDMMCGAVEEETDG